jgi:hypothetical protein
MVLASGRAKSSPRVKLRVCLPTVTVIVGSSARAKPDNSKKQNRTRARMMMEQAGVNSGATYVRFGSLADIAVRLRDVRFTPKSGH